MRIKIRNKFFTLGGSSVVRDVNDNDIAKVKGKIFSITRKKFIYDINDNLKYKVRNKFWHLIFKSAFIYDEQGNLVAQVKRKFHLLQSNFKILGTKDNLRIDGNIIGWNFNIMRDDKVIATISRSFNVAVDSFILDVIEPEDAFFCIALVIAIDNIIDREFNQSN